MRVTLLPEYAIAWAGERLTAPVRFAVLDTETTGLNGLAEVCQIAILRGDGEVLLDSLVKPTLPIPPEAYSIHGIMDDMVADAPDFAQIWPRIKAVVDRVDFVLAYNAQFDWRILHQSAWMVDIFETLDQTKFEDVKMFYEAYCGKWSSRRNGWRQQKLPGGDHSAMNDCRATLQLMRRMAISGEVLI